MRFFAAADCHPQTIDVLKTRAEPLGIELELVDLEALNFRDQAFGLLLQLPGCSGKLWNPTEVAAKAHEKGIIVTASIDPLAQVLMAPVGHLGIDIAIGSSQRFGVPMGFGGPHAAFFATKKNF